MTRIEELRAKKEIELNVKALYIVSLDLETVWDYLNGVIEREVITEEEADQMVERISNSLAETYCFQLEEIRNAIRNIGK